jgi:hypothetical protein
MTREPLIESQIRSMRSRMCPFCRIDSSRAVGTRVDIWAKCQNCRSISRDIAPVEAVESSAVHRDYIAFTICLRSGGD